MVLRSLGNPSSGFDDYRLRTAKGASAVAPNAASASGGGKVIDGDNIYHIFMGGNGPDYAGNPISAETFTINSGTITNAEILVVGRGGSEKNDGGVCCCER